jgi:ribosomal protein L17
VPTPKPTSPTETGTHNEQPGPKDAAPGNKPSVEDSPTKGGGAKDEAAAKAVDTAVVEDPVKAGTEKAAEQGTTEAPKPAPELPAPGSSKGRKAAKQIIDGVATGGEPHGSVEDAIKLAGDWKSTLKKALSKFTGDERRAAEDALVKARDKIVEDTWKKVQEANKPRFDKLRLENAGTKSFGSDIDATVRPLEGTEAGGSGADMAEQIKNAGEAAKEMSKALRDRVGGETDVVIDTNIYSFIGEGRIKPTDPKARGAQQHVDVLVGLAEQMRGQSEKQFNEFVGRLKNRLKDPRFQTEMDALIGEAKEFHKDRVKEFSEAVDRAKANKDNKGDAAQKRAAREELLQTKKNELADLMNTDKPDVGKITRKQAEINWYAPDAYATPSAFKQAVAHGQRLKGSARASAEWTPKEVATKLREAAGRLKPDDPQAAKLKADADLVDSQSRLLESTLREHKALVAESPMNAERVNQLERRAAQLREAIADRANKVMIAEIMGETAPSDRPSGERLSESAAASGANMGMLEDHMAHAPDLDGMVKAAAKYAGRIAMAEFLSGLRPSGEPISRLIAEFVKGRWGIMEDASPQIMRDMFVRYARLTGRHTELAYNSRGEAIGATDALKQAFAHDVRSWARQTNENIQVAAMESKTFDNPTPAMPTPAPDGTGGGSGGGAGAPGPDAGGGAGGGGIKGPPAGGGGGSEPPPSSGSGPASSSDRPTIPAPAPEDNGPATVKNPKPAPDDNGPATKKVGAGEGPAGGVVVDPPDGIATVVRAKNHPQDLVRLEVIGNQIRLTDIYRTTQTEVSGSTLLTAALKEVGAVAGNELYIHNIVNPETVSAYKDGIHAELSKLGRTAARGLEGAGLAAGPMRWHHDGEKLFISIEIK